MKQWKILKKENLHLQFSDDILFPLTLGKPETTLLGIGNLNFFLMIDINEMAAIF